MADVSFNIANPYQQQQEELARRQKMAEILQQQSFQPIERTSYAGIEAPISPYAGLAKMLQAYTGAKGQRDVAAERAALADEARNRSSMEGREFIGALKGTPEIPMPAEEQGGGPGRPAQGPDMARALEMSMNSVNPMVQSAGGAMLTQRLKTCMHFCTERTGQSAGGFIFGPDVFLRIFLSNIFNHCNRFIGQHIAILERRHFSCWRMFQHFLF